MRAGMRGDGHIRIVAKSRAGEPSESFGPIGALWRQGSRKIRKDIACGIYHLRPGPKPDAFCRRPAIAGRLQTYVRLLDLDVAPASSSLALVLSASAFGTPSRIAFGAASTRSLASLARAR